jgi:hypothetical protein
LLIVVAENDRVDAEVRQILFVAVPDKVVYFFT